jgi:hypothetical protein
MKLINLNQQYRPAPNTTEARRETDWTKLSNKNLKFALDKLELHQSPWVVEVYAEIENRISSGTWLNVNNPPPPLENMPFWLKIFPFNLLWRQRPK